MTHFPIVIITENPGDVTDVLAPFDENLDVTPYPLVLDTVAEAASSARSVWLDMPECICQSVWRWYSDHRSTAHKLDLGTQVTPGDKTAESWQSAYKDKIVWKNRDDACVFLAEVPDEVLALAWHDGYSGVRIEGKNVVYDSTCNPNGHWDWWTIGGRWRGFFYATSGMRILQGEPQPGDAVLGRSGSGESIEMRDCGRAVETYAGRADQLQWHDVDLDAMREHERAKAEQEYDAYERATTGTEVPTKSVGELMDGSLAVSGLPTDWAEYREATREQREQTVGDAWRKPWDDAIAEARAQWNGHPWVSALRKARIGLIDDPIDFYCVHTGGREEYVRRAVAATGVPYALVIKGEWIAKGRMGWFGMSVATATQDEWNTAVRAFYGQLGDDMWVTAVDCHV